MIPKRGQANLLGGRAWRCEMFPLTSVETGIDVLNLLRALNHGLIPVHYLQDNYRKSLESYVRDYLKEEVFNEGLSRNAPCFTNVRVYFSINLPVLYLWIMLAISVSSFSPSDIAFL
jgi:hypothetical protein